MTQQAIRTMKIPFQIDNRGGLAFVSTAQEIVQQQITDILATNRFERVMKPEYGADMNALLFAPKRTELTGIRAGEIKSLLQFYVKLARIVEVRIRPDNAGDATLRIDVSYEIGPSPQVYTVTHFASGLITEESM